MEGYLPHSQFEGTKAVAIRAVKSRKTILAFHLP